MKKLFIIVSILNLIGCASLNNPHDPALITSANLAGGKGVILLSAGADKKCMSLATFLQINPGEGNANDVNSVLAAVDVYAMKPDFVNHFGFLHALELPAGRYYFSPWVANPYVNQNKFIQARLEVVEGEISYLGEYYLTKSCGSDNQFEIRDRYERDIELFSEKNKLFSKSDVVKRIIERE
ncbi:hypothetical protein [Teredinibacter haidensis]|uniref:hypothetical protein n=1 Tax=Teredinibacter haidensis TaxID=2731755 RepID=UPI000AE81E7F|nr:hypothetical protein [Teredinibacter haidensis]